MKTFKVTEKATGDIKFQYDSEAAIEWNEYPFSLYDHTEFPYVEPGSPPAPVPSSTPLTKLQFLRRFTQNERIAMRAAASQSAAMYDYMALLELAEEVVLSDPDTMMGVQMMEMAGIIGAGRANEVLYG